MAKMKNKRSTLQFLIFLIVILALTVQSEQVCAPELFGKGAAMWFRASHLEAGIIGANWGDQQLVFAAAGWDGQGYMAQIWGPRIDQYGPYEKSNHWKFYYERQVADDAWRGRMEFRGHFRAFCGGSRVPQSCLWK